MRLRGALAFVAMAVMPTTAGGSEATGAVSPVRNGGFQEGSTDWALSPAGDYAVIEAVDDLSAPGGGKALLFDHQRTRTSIVVQGLNLNPYSFYLLTFWARAEDYIRTGMGLRVMVSGASTRYSESRLSEQWEPKIVPFVTGENGKPSLSFYLQSAAGRIWIDNVRVVESTRTEARRLMGSPAMIPRIPLEKAQAECCRWRSRNDARGGQETSRFGGVSHSTMRRRLRPGLGNRRCLRGPAQTKPSRQQGQERRRDSDGGSACIRTPVTLGRIISGLDCLSAGGPADRSCISSTKWGIASDEAEVCANRALGSAHGGFRGHEHECCGRRP